MKDGFYLSIYAHISNLTHLMKLGVRDNQSMALWKKSGEKISLVHYWEFERLSGLKQHKFSFYDLNHAKKVINNMLGQYNLSLEDMVEVFGTPGLDTCSDYNTLLEYPEYSYHSIAHNFASMMIDTNIFYNEDILSLAVDGGPDNVVDTAGRSKFFYTGIVSKHGKVELHPIDSPGALWIFMKYRYEMEEGSLMALGSASLSKAFINVDELMNTVPQIRKFKDIDSAYKWFEKLAEKIEKFEESDENKLFNYFDNRFTEKENKISIIVKIIQEISIKIMENNINRLVEIAGINPKKTFLALSGGYALNCPTNTYLLGKYEFKGFIAPPCVSDTGMSLGIGLYYFYKNFKVDFVLQGAYYGDEASEKDVQLYLNKDEYKHFIKSVKEFSKDQIVKDIKNQPIVWFDGRAEIGPRALGARSILADPRNPDHKDKLNEIKKRQWWRPVAPIILEEALSEWVESRYKSPYMLMATKIKKEKQELVPAILHLDNTARIQTININGNISVYNIVKAFYEDTGVPIICNTSLNDKGEPIINTVGEALNFALRKNIPIIYINGTRIELQNFDFYENREPETRSDMFIYKLDNESKEEVLSKLNPYGLSRQELILYFNNPELYEYELTNEKDVKILRRMFKHMPAMPL